MDELTDLYDNPPTFKYRAKIATNAQAENVCFNFIAGCTPKAVRDTFTDAIFEMGFPSRFIMVWADESPQVHPFASVRHVAELERSLEHDLEIISQMHGEYTWEQRAWDMVDTWWRRNLEPKPKDARLVGYNTRRLIHFCKLSTIIAASRHDDRVIYLEDAAAAKDLLEEAEAVMPFCISGTGKNPFYDSMKLAVRVIAAEARANGGNPVPDRKVRRVLNREVPPNVMPQLLREMRASSWVLVVGEQDPFSYLPNYEEKDQWSK